MRENGEKFGEENRSKQIVIKLYQQKILCVIKRLKASNYNAAIIISLLDYSASD